MKHNAKRVLAENLIDEILRAELPDAPLLGMEDIIENQKELTGMVDKHGYIFRDTRDLVMSYMAWIVGETDEVNREVNYKVWKKPQPISNERLFSEVADIFIFWLDLCVRLGVEDEIWNVIRRKQEENIERQLGNVKGKEDYKA